MRVRVHIERVVVDEALASGGDPRALQAAFEAEAARALAANPALVSGASGGAHARLVAPAVTLPQGAGAGLAGARLGRSLAGGVADALGGEGGRRR